MAEILAESIADTARLIPWLFPIYVLMEYVSHREVPVFVRRLRLGGAAGPIAGAFVGIIPQCSMSVMVTSLFAAGHVSAGTLLATYLATSDEALPILLAEGSQFRAVFALVGAKLAIALIAGYLADAALGRQHLAPGPTHAFREPGSHTESVSWPEIIGHGSRHTAVVAAWVLVATFLLGVLLERSGGLEWISGGGSVGAARVLAVALFGLIPNCATSVAITEAFLRAGLPFGAAIAGLSAGAGFGPIVLVREVGLRRSAVVLAWLLASAVVSGLVIDALYPLSLPVTR
ncbi:MAG: putative manganese transporter [Vicinamibacterales bacterium]